MMSVTHLFSIISLTIIVTNISCYSKRHNVCDVKHFDGCVANYFNIFNGTTNVAESEDDLKIWCRIQMPREDKCIRDYTNKCMRTFLRQSWTIMRYTITRTYKAKCDSNLSDDRLYSIGKCWNPKKKVFLETCFVEFMDHLIEIKKFNDNRLKLGSLCCRYWDLFNCLTNLIRKDAGKIGSVCTVDHVTEIDSAMKSLAGQQLSPLCANKYADGSDECKQLLATQKRVRHGSVKWKSPAKYFSDILDSF